MSVARVVLDLVHIAHQIRTRIEERQVTDVTGNRYRGILEPVLVIRRVVQLHRSSGQRLAGRIGGHLGKHAGRVDILDYVAVEDVGRIINPLTLKGQVIGSLVQGLGGAFLEHLVYDEHGQLLTGSLMDYLLPTATDFPNLRSIATDEKPSPINPLGAKGAGEGGMIAAGGVMANAVANALADFGVEPRELPLSPPRVWELLNAAKQGRKQAAE